MLPSIACNSNFAFAGLAGCSTSREILNVANQQQPESQLFGTLPGEHTERADIEAKTVV